LLSLQTTTKILLKNTLVKGFYKKGSLTIKSRLIDNYIIIGTGRDFKSLYSLYLEALFLLQELHCLITSYILYLRFRI
jgi:hypothetical protein